MDILIKGLEMPKSYYSEVYSSDGYCPFHFFSTRDGSQCSISPCKCLKTRRPKDCPLIPVPTPIGYKTEADVLLKLWMDEIITDGEYNKIMERLNKAVVLERTT